MPGEDFDRGDRHGEGAASGLLDQLGHAALVFLAVTGGTLVALAAHLAWTRLTNGGESA